MNQKPLSEYTDIELAEIQGQSYQQLIQTQGNLVAINQEIQKRKKPAEKPAEKK